LDGQALRLDPGKIYIEQVEKILAVLVTIGTMEEHVSASRQG